jgi:hypothetical protein
MDLLKELAQYAVPLTLDALDEQPAFWGSSPAQPVP